MLVSAVCEGGSTVGMTSVVKARRAQIIDAARVLYEKNGIDRTSVKDIAEQAGITRSLFYHYFSRKEDVTDAILEQYVSGFVKSMEEWNEQRTRGDVRGALYGCVDILRNGLFSKDSFRKDLLKNQNAALYQQFVQRVAGTMADYMTRTTAEEYARYHKVEVSHVYESFYLLITGLIGYLRQNPDAPDDLVADLIADTLHLELD